LNIWKSHIFCTFALFKSASDRSFHRSFQKCDCVIALFVRSLKKWDCAIALFGHSIKKCDCGITLFGRSFKKVRLCDRTFCCSFEKCVCAIALFLAVQKKCNRKIALLKRANLQKCAKIANFKIHFFAHWNERSHIFKVCVCPTLSSRM